MSFRPSKYLSAFLAILIVWAMAPTAWAEDASATATPQTGFQKPYEAEKEAFGYDPEGIEYHQNRLEDFQVILVSSAPFVALLSYGVTSLVSTINRGTGLVNGEYTTGFIIGTAVGATAIATVSVIGKKYTPPPTEVLLPHPVSDALVFHATLITARF